MSLFSVFGHDHSVIKKDYPQVSFTYLKMNVLAGRFVVILPLYFRSDPYSSDALVKLRSESQIFDSNVIFVYVTYNSLALFRSI